MASVLRVSTSPCTRVLRSGPFKTSSGTAQWKCTLGCIEPLQYSTHCPFAWLQYLCISQLCYLYHATILGTASETIASAARKVLYSARMIQYGQKCTVMLRSDLHFVITALIEAIMGFQFNHVGGGTKTRRPISLEMVFDGDCHEPQCELADENDDNEFNPLSLEALHDHIQQENDSLEAQRTFSERDIIVRMRYEFCANLTIIDTPGVLIACHRSIHISTDSYAFKEDF